MALPSIRAGLETLRGNPMRTMLSTLGVIMGSASLVAVLSLGDGAEMVARQRIQQEGYNHIVVEPITSDSVDGERIPRTSVITLTPADADALAPVVATRATGALNTQGSLLWTPPTGGSPRGLRVVGISPLGDALSPVSRIVSGRTLTPAETRSGAAVCVVSERLAALLVNDKPTAPAGGASAGSASAGGAPAGSAPAGRGTDAAAAVPAANAGPVAGASVERPGGAGAGTAVGAPAPMGTIFLSVAGREWGIVGVQQDLLGVGLIFGTYPAFRASRLSPVDAIQRE